MIKLGNRMIKEPVPGNTPQSCLQPGPSNWLLVASSLLLSSCLSAIQWTGINLLLCLTANSPHHLLSVFCVNQAIVWCFWTHKLNLHSHPGRWLFLSSLCRWDESLSEQLPQTKARSYFLTMTQWCINIKFHLLSMAFMSRFPPLSPCVDPCSVKGLNLPPPSIFAFSFLPQALYLPSAWNIWPLLSFRYSNYSSGSKITSWVPGNFWFIPKLRISSLAPLRTGKFHSWYLSGCHLSKC